MKQTIGSGNSVILSDEPSFVSTFFVTLRSRSRRWAVGLPFVIDDNRSSIGPRWVRKNHDKPLVSDWVLCRWTSRRFDLEQRVGDRGVSTRSTDPSENKNNWFNVINLYMRIHKEITQNSSKISKKLRRFFSWEEGSNTKPMPRTLSSIAPKFWTKPRFSSASVFFSGFVIWADGDDEVKLFALSYLRCSYFGRMTLSKWFAAIHTSAWFSSTSWWFHGIVRRFFKHLQSTFIASTNFASEEKIAEVNASIDRSTYFTGKEAKAIDFDPGIEG